MTITSRQLDTLRGWDLSALAEYGIRSYADLESLTKEQAQAIATGLHRDEHGKRPESLGSKPSGRRNRHLRRG